MRIPLASGTGVIYSSSREFYMERWLGGMNRLLLWSLKGDHAVRIELLCMYVRYYNAGTYFTGLQIEDLGEYSSDMESHVPWKLAYPSGERVYRLSSAEGQGILVGGDWGIEEGADGIGVPSRFPGMQGNFA